MQTIPPYDASPRGVWYTSAVQRRCFLRYEPKRADHPRKAMKTFAEKKEKKENCAVGNIKIYLRPNVRAALRMNVSTSSLPLNIKSF